MRVRGSGFWLMGVAATHCCQLLIPLLPTLIPFIAPGLEQKSNGMTVNMNTAYAITELCKKGVPADPLLPHLEGITMNLLRVVQRRPDVDIKPWQRQGHMLLLNYTVQALQGLRERTP